MQEWIKYFPQEDVSYNSDTSIPTIDIKEVKIILPESYIY